MADFSLGDSNFVSLSLCSFMILTRLCYCPRPSWIWELAEERRSQPSHGVGTAASGLTLDQVEALELMSQCNGGETDDSRPLPFSFFFFPSLSLARYFQTCSLWRVLDLCQRIRPLCSEQEVSEDLNFF